MRGILRESELEVEGGRRQGEARGGEKKGEARGF